MRVEPVSPEVVVQRIADRVVALAGGTAPGRRWRVVLDGAPPTDPGALARGLVEPLRVRGRQVVLVAAEDFLRPASVRWERGRHDPDALYEDALDAAALVREVLDPTGPGGDGTYLPALWDAARDRSARALRQELPADGVLVLHGSLLLGRGLPADLTVHLAARPDTLARRTPPEDAWRLRADERHRRDAAPERTADVVVRVDDPRHPGWVSER